MFSTTYPGSTQIGLVLPTQRHSGIHSDVCSDPLAYVIKDVADEVIDEISTWMILRETYPELRVTSAELLPANPHYTHKEDVLQSCGCRILILQVEALGNPSLRGG